MSKGVQILRPAKFFTGDLDFIRRVRVLKERDRNLKIVVLTAYDAEDINGSFDATHDFLLSKPVDLDQFASVIESLQSRGEPKFTKLGTHPYATSSQHPVPLI